MAGPVVPIMRAQMRLTEHGTWVVTITGQVRGEYRSETHHGVEDIANGVRLAVDHFLTKYGKGNT